MSLSAMSDTSWPGTPMMDDVHSAPVATRLEIVIFVSAPAAGTLWPQPRSPSRTKMGARTFIMVIPVTTTCSSLPPSTLWIETPALGNGVRSKGGCQNSARPDRVQFRNTMFRKSPLDSVPILSPLRTLTRSQSVTTTYSVGRRTPRARLLLSTMASSRDSTRQPAMRT